VGQVRQVRKERNALIATLRQLERENDARLAAIKRQTSSPNLNDTSIRSPVLASPGFDTPIKQVSHREDETRNNVTTSDKSATNTGAARNPDASHASNNNEHDGKGFERRTQRALSESPLNISSSSKFSPRKGGMLAARIALLDAQEERNLRKPGVSVNVEHDSDSSSGSPVSKHIRGNVGGRLDRLAATVDDLLRD
jgi:hypothetical protein